MLRMPPTSRLFPYTTLFRSFQSSGPCASVSRATPPFPSACRPSPITEKLSSEVVAGCDRLIQAVRSEEHTSELQSLTNLVCRLLLEKKKKAISGHIGPVAAD